MQLLHKDFRKGTVRCIVNELEDLWHLAHLIDPGDMLRAKTHRKMKIGDEQVKKTLSLTIEAETVELSDAGQALRINGRVKEAPEDVPLNSYHALSLEKGTEFQLQKVQWLEYQKKKLEEAARKKYLYLLCLLDREEALFALTRQQGYKILVKLQGEAQKKRLKAEKAKAAAAKDFQAEIIKALDVYAGRYAPERIILASPAFFKEELYAKLPQEIKRQAVQATCSDVSERALDEVLRQPELKEVLQASRFREEQLAVDELLLEIRKDSGLAVYGWEEVQKAAEHGAVQSLLLTDTFIKKRRLENAFAAVDDSMKKAEQMQGAIHIISSTHEGGRKLDGLGGIAAVLRYKLR